MRERRWLCSLGLLLLLSTCAHRAAADGRAWHAVRSWAFQLQQINLADVRQSGFDLVVLDYSQDGTEAKRFTRADISSIQNSPRGRKRVLAYLSIGEAESYRYYWQSQWYPGHPEFVGPENPHWKKNYTAKFWDPQWQDIICGGKGSYLDRILDAGFDGVYLDIVDGYEDWEAKGFPQAGTQMKQFVERIATYARQHGGGEDFGVFPQNAEALLADEIYGQAVTGVGREDTFYGSEDENVRSPGDFTQLILKGLAPAVHANKLVLNVDYCWDPDKVADAYARARAAGYIEYCTTVNLDTLTINRGYDP